MVLTFIAASFWHGTKFNFLVYFIYFFLMVYLEKVAKRTKLCVWIGKNIPWVVYFPIKWLHNYFTLGYLGISFLVPRFA